jgi:beta-lactam-binding protein with PASTA domain
MEIGSVATLRVPDSPAETVIAQSPLPDATDVNSPRIALALSAAESPREYVMPSFTGKPLAEASAAVLKAGLTLGGKWGAVAAEVKSTKNKLATPGLTGTVVKQYPLPGQKVSTGTPVYFEVMH